MALKISRSDCQLHPIEANDAENGLVVCQGESDGLLTHCRHGSADKQEAPPTVQARHVTSLASSTQEGAARLDH